MQDLGLFSPSGRLGDEHGEARRLLEGRLPGLGHRLSEYCVANLLLFGEVHDYRMQAGPLPCISGVTYDGHRHLLPLFELSAVPPAELRRRLSGHDFYYPICETTRGRLAADAFEISFNPDDSDYLYQSARLASYTGPLLAKKANLARQFQRLAKPNFVALTPGRTADALDMLDRWLAQSGKAEAATDFRACRRALQSREALGLQGRIAYTSTGEASGLLIFSEVWPDTLVVHFAKGLREPVGSYPYMFQQLAIEQQGRYTFFNFEQDLGSAGLRQNKRSFAPLRQLHKLRVRPRQ